MRELPRIRTTPPDIDLGPLSSLMESSGRGVVIVSSETRFHGFVVRRGEAVHGYVDLCPHAGLPLAQQLDTYMTSDSQHI
jgi:nitrite reductase/ring-hydroxylating ferredoxin subunit